LSKGEAALVLGLSLLLGGCSAEAGGSDDSRSAELEAAATSRPPDATTNLTQHPAEDRSPAWSPDGRRLLFESDRDGNRDIYVMAADGTGVQRLTHDEGEDAQPAWAPDGRRIVFRSDRDAGTGLWKLDLEPGATPVFLLADSSPELTPDWAPDGSRIAFTSVRSGNADIWTVPAEGGQLIQLTTSEYRDVWPRWSADGQWLVFFSRRDTNGEWDQLYSLNWASRNVHRLTDQPTHHHFTPDWSPDGSRMITALSDSVADRALAIFSTAGELESRFAESYSRVFQPAWSPDGRHVAYAARPRDGDAAEIFVHPLAR
jgi:Tol biopolymer transport system component